MGLTSRRNVYYNDNIISTVVALKKVWRTELLSTLRTLPENFAWEQVCSAPPINRLAPYPSRIKTKATWEEKRGYYFCLQIHGHTTESLFMPKFFNLSWVSSRWTWSKSIPKWCNSCNATEHLVVCTLCHISSYNAPSHALSVIVWS